AQAGSAQHVTSFRDGCAMIMCAPLMRAPKVLRSSRSRQVAVTIDDLPATGDALNSAAALKQMTARWIAGLKRFEVPVVAFVNEVKLFFKLGEVDERIKILATWLDSGFELANHTFSHSSLNEVGPRVFEEDVVR